MDLVDLIHRDRVRANASASTRAEAVAIAGEALVGTGTVEPQYVKAMQQALEDIGAYIVVAPGVALPHARPEDGVRAPGASIVTLDTPVAFGHTQNDPVDVVVAFAAADKSTHLQALQQLAELLGDQDALARIRAASDDGALYEAVCATRG